MWMVCWILAWAVLILSAVFAWMTERKKKGYAGTSLYEWLWAGYTGAVFFTVLPASLTTYAGTDFSVVKAIMATIQSVPRFWAFAVEPANAFRGVPETEGWLRNAYLWFLLALYLIGPLFTAGLVIALVKNCSNGLRWFLNRRREAYVFSRLNEQSLALAGDIWRSHPKALIVFTGAPDNGHKGNDEKVQRARKMRALCYKKTFLTMNYKVHSASAPMFFFAIDSKEENNVRESLTLLQQYGERESSMLYVFASGVESEMVFSNAWKTKMKIRRINEEQSVIFHLLYEQGHTLFEQAVESKEYGKLIHAVLVGLDGFGSEMMKALSWFCQMDGYRIEMDVFDADPLAEKKIEAQCPDFIREPYNGGTVPGEAEYRIRIHAGVQESTSDFTEAVRALNDVTFVFVSMGSDEHNVKTAAGLRVLFERSGQRPVIYAMIRDSSQKAILQKANDFSGSAYRLLFAGDFDATYSESVIMHSELEQSAYSIHKSYCDGHKEREEAFWQYEYNYLSSMATALHSHVMRQIGSRIDATDPIQKKRLEEIEHRRWNAYMRSYGYIYGEETENGEKHNSLAKTHNDLVAFSLLSEKEKRKDSLVKQASCPKTE